MNIGVYGYTDKRMIIYPILKLLQAAGDVAFFTNNRHYSRLLEDNTDSGYIANILICVSDATPDEVFEQLGYTPDDFDHIVFDMVDSIPEQLDLSINVMTYALDESDLDFLSLLDNVKTIKIAYERSKGKEEYVVTPSIKTFAAIERFEQFRVLESIDTPSITNTLSNLISPKLGMSPKNCIAVMTRGWNG